MQRLIKRIGGKTNGGVPEGDTMAEVASSGPSLQPHPEAEIQQQPQQPESSSQADEKPQQTVQAQELSQVPINSLPWAGANSSHLEAEEVPADDDADSAIGSDAVSSTASLTSTILEYRTLHGRRYHCEMNNLQYWAANDEQQSEVMDLNHHTLTLAIGGRLYLPPLEKEKVKKVLDVGTGTGIWAIDFADEFPDAEIIGTDISPIQPSWVPPNLQFEIEDCSQEWTFRSETFDFIHMRWLVGGINDWYELFRQAYRTLQPGGWIQSLETSPHLTSDDGTVTPDSAMGQWGKFFVEGGKKLGRPFTVVDEGLQKKAMAEAGFVDIQEYDFKMPLGGWPKDPTLKQMGQFAEVVLDNDVEGYVFMMANTLGWARDEIIVYVSMLRRELKNPAIHCYYNQRVVWGRKPEL